MANKEQIDLEKERIISDGELLKKGADLETDDKGEKVIVATEKQKKRAGKEMSREFKERETDNQIIKEHLTELEKRTTIEKGEVLPFDKICNDLNINPNEVLQSTTYSAGLGIDIESKHPLANQAQLYRNGLKILDRGKYIVAEKNDPYEPSFINEKIQYKEIELKDKDKQKELANEYTDNIINGFDKALEDTFKDTAIEKDMNALKEVEVRENRFEVYNIVFRIGHTIPTLLNADQRYKLGRRDEIVSWYDKILSQYKGLINQLDEERSLLFKDEDKKDIISTHYYYENAVDSKVHLNEIPELIEKHGIKK